MKDKTKVKKKELFKSINKKLIVAIGILAISFFATQMFIASSVGTKSEAIEDIRIQKDQLRLENEILQAKIDKKRSITNIEKIAEKYNLQEKQVNSIYSQLENLALGNE